MFASKPSRVYLHNGATMHREAMCAGTVAGHGRLKHRSSATAMSNLGLLRALLRTEHRRNVSSIPTTRLAPSRKAVHQRYIRKPGSLNEQKTMNLSDIEIARSLEWDPRSTIAKEFHLSNEAQ